MDCGGWQLDATHPPPTRGDLTSDDRALAAWEIGSSSRRGPDPVGVGWGKSSSWLLFPALRCGFLAVLAASVQVARIGSRAPQAYCHKIMMLDISNHECGSDSAIGSLGRGGCMLQHRRGCVQRLATRSAWLCGRLDAYVVAK